MRMDHPLPLAALALAALTACDRGTPPSPAATTPAGVVDSFVPREVALERFRAALPRVDTLAHASPSRDALVRRFVAALERGDRATLDSMAVTQAEFAWLYYPTTPQGLPPYDLPPGLLWFTLDGNSRKGIGRALVTFGGRPLGYQGYRCDPEPSREGENLVWGPCTLSVTSPDGARQEVRLLALILERQGRFKVLSYANKL